MTQTIVDYTMAFLCVTVINVSSLLLLLTISGLLARRPLVVRWPWDLTYMTLATLPGPLLLCWLGVDDRSEPLVSWMLSFLPVIISGFTWERAWVVGVERAHVASLLRDSFEERGWKVHHAGFQLAAPELGVRVRVAGMGRFPIVFLSCHPWVGPEGQALLESLQRRMDAERAPYGWASWWRGCSLG